MASEQATGFEPDAIADRKFRTSFRGYDKRAVREFLAALAADHRDLLARLATAEAAAADMVAAAAQRGVEVLREAHDEAERQLAGVAAEREQAYADAVADADATSVTLLADARAEAEALVSEATAARQKVLADLHRRRKAARVQVEQLNAARERLLAALATVSADIEVTTAGLRDALPEAKSAADAAARRVEAEPDTSVEELDAEIGALRSAGLSFGAGLGAESEVDRSGTADEIDVEEYIEEDAASAVFDAKLAVSDDRRSSSVRIIRPMLASDPVTGLPEGELEPVDLGDPVEEVRLLSLVEDIAETEEIAQVAHEPGDEAVEEPAEEPLEAAAAAAEEASEREPEPEPDPAPESDPEADEAGRLSPVAVDALFARLRAGRDDRVAETEAVLDPGPEPDAERGPEREPAGEPEVDESTSAVEGLAVHRGGGAARDALLARRDELVAPAQAALVRRLKRVLADEQNELLDAIRRLGPVQALPDVDAHAGRWAQAAAPDLAVAAAAGSSFLGGESPVVEPTPSELAEVAESLATVVARPLHERLLSVIEAADADSDAAAAGVRACYRTWRSERLLPAADHAALDAFALGVDRALGEGTPVCWIADDGGVPCPDAEDNALAGEVPCGLRFPTGHLRPPAHQGCRCLVTRVST